MVDIALAPGRLETEFAAEHPWDRNFFLAMIAVLWVVMIAGFGIDMTHRAAGHLLTYPLVVHAHALVYVGWLALLTTQVLLIRKGNYALHRRLGLFALVLLPLMAVLGPATAIVVDTQQFGHPKTEFPFMATQFTNVLGAIVLLGAGVMLRKDASSHKRLMLMGTIAISEPGFSRIWAHALSLIFGDGFWPYLLEIDVGTVVLVLVVGGYDLITRRRLHPAYVAAAVWIFANEMLAAWLFQQPWWVTMTRHFAGH